MMTLRHKQEQRNRQTVRVTDTLTDKTTRTNWIKGWKLENNVDIINYSLNRYINVNGSNNNKNSNNKNKNNQNNTEKNCVKT